MKPPRIIHDTKTKIITRLLDIIVDMGDQKNDAAFAARWYVSNKLGSWQSYLQRRIEHYFEKRDVQATKECIAYLREVRKAYDFIRKHRGRNLDLWDMDFS